MGLGETLSERRAREPGEREGTCYGTWMASAVDREEKQGGAGRVGSALGWEKRGTSGVDFCFTMMINSHQGALKSTFEARQPWNCMVQIPSGTI